MVCVLLLDGIELILSNWNNTVVFGFSIGVLLILMCQLLLSSSYLVLLSCEGVQLRQLTHTGQRDIPYHRASCSGYKLGEVARSSQFFLGEGMVSGQWMVSSCIFMGLLCMYFYCYICILIPSSSPLPAPIIIILPYSNYSAVLMTTHEPFTILLLSQWSRGGEWKGSLHGLVAGCG